MKQQPVYVVLKDARQKKNFSVLEVKKLLSSKYGISVSDKTIYKWESGAVRINADTFLALCQIYDIRDLKVFTERRITDSEIVLTDAERYVIRAYRKHEQIRKEIQKITGMPFSLSGNVGIQSLVGFPKVFSGLSVGFEAFHTTLRKDPNEDRPY